MSRLAALRSEAPASAITRNDFFEVVELARKRLVLVTRLPGPAMTEQDVLRIAEQMTNLMRPSMKSWGIVVDSRAGPGSADEGFERASAQLRQVTRKFGRHAVLVGTAVGKLQVMRLSRQDGTPALVTDDEDLALSHALGESPPARSV